MRLPDYSNLAGRLVGQEMFFILDRAKQIEQSGGKVRHLELGDPELAADSLILDRTSEYLKKGHYHYTPIALKLHSQPLNHNLFM